ncbi:VWA domain-containing protein (plasmid) [Paracoccus yeei]|uniref:VWA domain-containing protein n=1 Tax=Paracoccus yeei TaxID=147645 RepID=A0A386UTC9_9RHOB|nr:VWA domain-containing protein [Paracoccus yeei]AYF03686.1 VWA domain-containing protein [Paracoccus yeei]
MTLLRPEWLLALLPLLGLRWLLLRRQRPDAQALADIAPHLRAALTIGRHSAGGWLRPPDLVLGAAALMALGAAGPAFRLAPSPFVSQTAPMIVALDLSPGMAQGDVAPSRLERGKQKIRDLIALRAGGRVGLVAYAGSAHLVMPPTEDQTVLLPFLEGLTPGIMPVAGQRPSQAMALAASLLGAEAQPGSLLLVTDGVDPTDTPPAGSGAVALIVAPAVPPEVEAWASQGGIRTVLAATGDSDLARVNRALASQLVRAGARDGRLQDDGWALALPAGLLLLWWFRRGTTLHWMLLVGLWLQPAPGGAEELAGGLADLFLTPDQQGARAYAARHFPQAADLFQDPAWQAAALLRAGRYPQAAAVLAPLPGRDARFNQGVALVRARDYRGARAAFKAAVDLDPGDHEAAENLALTDRILAYLDATRAAEDDDQDDPDATVQDAPPGSGRRIRITADSDLSADAAAQWMRQVQTRPADFLKSRFAVEAATQKAAGP